MSLSLASHIFVVAACLGAVITPTVRAMAQQQGIEVQIHAEKTVLTPGARDPSAASTKIPKERLRSPGMSTADVLSQVPGVQTSKSGAASDLSTASIRGSTSAQTPVYLAGIRLNDDITGTADLSVVPLWMIDHVEVYRGNAPFEADRLGIGGAIFFEPVLPRASRLGGGLGGGSHGELSTWTAGAVGDDRGGAILAARRESATNDYAYVDDRGTRFDPSDDRVSHRVNADYVAYDFWSVGRLHLRRGSITTIANTFVRDQGVTGLSVIPAHAARSHVQRWLGAIAAKVPCATRASGESDDHCRLELISSALLAKNRILDPLRELGLLSTSVASAGARVSQQARLRYRLGAVDLGASLSQEFDHLGIDRSEEPPLHADRSSSRAGASVVADVTQSVQLNGLAVIECHTTTGPGRGGACGALQPFARIGARVALPWSIELLVNAGRYARLPTLGEIYGTSPIVRGNPDLEVERGYTTDLGARFRASDISIEAFGFAQVASDLIAFRRSSVGVVRPFNIGSARMLGVEVTASVSFIDAVRVELSLTALDPRDTSETRLVKNDIIPFQARLVAVPALEIYQERPRWLPVDRIALDGRLSYRSSRAADPAGLIILGEQAILDVDLAVLFWQKRIATRFRLANVLGSMNSDMVGLPLPGRSIHGSMEVWWW